MNKENINNLIENDNDSINIKDELGRYLVHWKWFFLALIISLSIAFVYLRYSIPIYNASTMIMIKDNQKSGISEELKAFNDLGIVGGASTNNPDNEVEILKSRKIIGSVVDNLKLTISYFVQGRIKEAELYNKSPIKLTFINGFRRDTIIKVLIKDAETFNLYDADDEIKGTEKFGKIINSKIGDFKIDKILNSKNEVENKIKIAIVNKNKTINSYRSSITISPVDEKSSVLNLTLNNSVVNKAEDILNEVVKQYNIDAIKDKSLVANKTIEFIEERLKNVASELSKVQDNVKEFKAKKGFTGLSREGEITLEEGSFNNKKLSSIETELQLAKWIQESLGNQSKKEDILPSNLGFTNLNITKAIIDYNELISKRDNLSLNAGVKNPRLIQLSSEIGSLKLNLKKSLQNLTASLEFQRNQIKGEQIRLNYKKSAIPLIERDFIDIAREQEIRSDLYSYLLTKKEETAISLAVTVPNAKIIDVAYGSNIPVSPKTQIIYLVAVLLGLLFPFMFIYVKNLLDTKIHSRKDLEELTNIPFLGDVPHSETNDKVIIDSNSRSSTAEAFRLIRTNLDFMLSTQSSDTDLGKTIFITSTTSGEGKSFISINLAAALSLSNKKVLLLGMDLRAPKVTEYLGIPEKRGITNYITNTDVKINDIKFTIPEIKKLDIIASGAIPPNPAELLLTSRVKDLFTELKNEYDYIIVDTAPVNLVTDTFLISKYADMFLYIARANYLDKRMLIVPQTLYNEKKLPNLSLVLNDTDINRGYGYGYGYGNAYLDDQKKKPWYKSFFKK